METLQSLQKLANEWKSMYEYMKNDRNYYIEQLNKETKRTEELEKKYNELIKKLR